METFTVFTNDITQRKRILKNKIYIVVTELENTDQHAEELVPQGHYTTEIC